MWPYFFCRPLAIFCLKQGHSLGTGLARDACVPREEEDGSRGRKRDADRGIVAGKPPLSSFRPSWSSRRGSPLGVVKFNFSLQLGGITQQSKSTVNNGA